MNSYTIVLADTDFIDQVQFETVEEFNTHLQEIAHEIMDEEGKDFLRFEVINWTKNISWISEIERKTTYTFSRTDC